MPRYVAFLRAINVGGRRVTNVDLCAALEGHGFAQVTAYQAAGNLILDTEETDPAVATQKIEDALEQALGYDVPTFLRTAEEVRALTTATPFDADTIAASTAKPQVMFLLTEPNEDSRAAALTASTDADQLAIVGRELHWLPTNGVGRSALDLMAVNKAVGPNTVRTLGTVERIAKKFLG